MSSVLVTNIQRMCFHDGPGIRTTVFLKGCGIHCPWCSNPENIVHEPEEYFIDGRKGVYGQEFNAEELLEIILRDVQFYDRNGGVTFSGGEPLLQIIRLIPVIEELRNQSVNIAIETSLFVPFETVRVAEEKVDFFVVDIKILDKDSCKDILGGNVDRYLENVEYLYKKNKVNLFRIPICYEYTFTKKNKRLLKEFVAQHSAVPIQIFAIHGLGEKKYLSLGRKMPKFLEVEKNDLEEFMSELNGIGAVAEIIQI